MSLQEFGAQEGGYVDVRDFSPSWDYEQGGVKVLITGASVSVQPSSEGEPVNVLGLGIFQPSQGYCCLFGEVVVSCEKVLDNVWRCYAPAHPPGVVRSLCR